MVEKTTTPSKVINVLKRAYHMDEISVIKVYWFCIVLEKLVGEICLWNTFILKGVTCILVHQTQK